MWNLYSQEYLVTWESTIEGIRPRIVYMNKGERNKSMQRFTRLLKKERKETVNYFQMFYASSTEIYPTRNMC